MAIIKSMETTTDETGAIDIDITYEKIKAHKIDVSIERIISGTGWINHYIAYTANVCELNEYCPSDTKDKMIDFLFDLFNITDRQAIFIGPILIEKIYNENKPRSDFRFTYNGNSVIV